MLLKATEMGLPIKKFLEISEMRQRFWHKDSWMIIPYALLLAGAINTTVMGRYWPEEWSTLLGYIVVNTGFFGFVAFAYWHNYREWKKKKKPFLNQIRELLQKLETE